MESCIFCRIIKKEIPSYEVYEDNDFLAFLDINPRTEGHTLVIPKNHYRWVYDVPNFGRYWEVTLKVTKAMQKALSPLFVSYFTYGMDVPHAHIHVLPRYEEGDLFPPIKKLTPDKMRTIAEKIKNNL